MTTFHSTVDIAAHREQVWETIADVERWGDWMPGVRSVTTTTPAGGQGAIYVLDQGTLGGQQRYRLQTSQPPEQLAFTTSGSTSTDVTYQLTALDEGHTRVECTFVMGGLAGAPVAALFTGSYQRQLDAEMVALKGRCEDRR